MVSFQTYITQKSQVPDIPLQNLTSLETVKSYCGVAVWRQRIKSYSSTSSLGHEHVSDKAFAGARGHCQRYFFMTLVVEWPVNQINHSWDPDWSPFLACGISWCEGVKGLGVQLHVSSPAASCNRVNEGSQASRMQNVGWCAPVESSRPEYVMTESPWLSAAPCEKVH